MLHKEPPVSQGGGENGANHTRGNVFAKKWIMLLFFLSLQGSQHQKSSGLGASVWGYEDSLYHSLYFCILEFLIIKKIKETKVLGPNR